MLYLQYGSLELTGAILAYLGKLKNPSIIYRLRLTKAYQLYGNLCVKGFLFNMAPLCFMTAGNFLHMVSYPTGYLCISYRQETFCVWFPIRLGAIAAHHGRKLFANSFPFDMTPSCFISIGNFLLIVSHSA